MDITNTGNRLFATDLFASLPPEWPLDPTAAIRRQVIAAGAKIVVLDDDPTGTQTVHDVPVLTEWSPSSLAAEFANSLTTVYLLTNSRSLAPAAAEERNAEIGANIVAASRQTNRPFAVISRSDSTLRGHFPGEVSALALALGQDFDAWLLIPFFEAGGRFTINDTHYVAAGDWLVPVGETEFARDASFGYRSSNLRQWVEEKTGGSIHATDVGAITLDDIRRGGPERVGEKLRGLPHNSVCVINAVSRRDLEVVTLAVLSAEAQGRRYLYRTAASFVATRAAIAPQPLLTPTDLQLPAAGGGLIIVGSYVPTTSGQIGALLQQPGITGIEAQVDALLNTEQRAGEIARVVQAVEALLSQDRDVVIYTSRRLISGDNAASSLAIGQQVSASLVNITRALTRAPRYVLAKGGITSSDIATHGLDVKRAMVLGQILPGVPVWRLGEESRFPGLAYIVFPGNVGAPNALVEIAGALKRDNN